MFLLKRATTVKLLMVTFGILLPNFYIQHAQGLKCYECTDQDDFCKTPDETKTKTQVCPEFVGGKRIPLACVEYELEYPNGTLSLVRGCEDWRVAFDHSYADICQNKTSHPVPYHKDNNVKILYCFCSFRGDLCNKRLVGRDPITTTTTNAFIRIRILINCSSSAFSCLSPPLGTTLELNVSGSVSGMKLLNILCISGFSQLIH
ncbi:hypothetical protein Ocin01_19436 [Orchesella cincta]|uniref:Uncharacterized protein n=1 Tax=Orchesella cincta TaxID=48709 RepID=A0A1D2M2Q1_ORCCI|nr:hypothetical protein Ocin01_19436 [Orchesella cincta]